MQMSDKVLTALEVLRDAAENDFERHRIDVLERDLTSPPVVEVVTEKSQRFNGVTYNKRKDGHYFSMKGIHCIVWQYYYGNIPFGYEIHHRNLNPADNDISNLQMLTSSEHARVHNQLKLQDEHICEYCGKTYRSTGRNGRNRFCSSKCNTAWQHENALETRVCIFCGKEFLVRRDLPTRYCSCRCSVAHLRKKPLEERSCAICGKKFFARPSVKTICCSASCGAKLASLHRGDTLVKPRKCVICGKEFTPSNKHTHTRTCSRPCASKLLWQTRKQNHPPKNQN